MLCLGIETSCDETAVALVRDGRLVGQKLATQIDVHAVFGGVVPEIASREHLRVLPTLFRELMEESGHAPEDIDAVAVARGPGLLGALLIGVSFAKALSLSCNARLVGVNHLWAHLLAPGLERSLPFPALGLLVSGGHTHTYRIDSPVEFELLGKTLDDAAGEAFDKVAKTLNFPYPGGKHVDELAQETEPDRKLFPRAFIDNPSLDFSFSGLKTAVAVHVQKHPEVVLPRMDDVDGASALGALLPDAREHVARICASFNWSVADTLRIKVERALKKTGHMKGLVVAGGVAANTMIRETMADLAQRYGLDLVLPGPALCTDNASMIAYSGWLMAELGLQHDLNLEAVPRGRVVPMDWHTRKAG
ncbi:tRNA (adenosine(37)-N6)-threonylcarbamoyltransferase complex transferase subunit TsaD [Pseudodesulfovibrio senegalensis]|jgi:N6-L-threonylcarbamoyladenine synthase|uniref:tRNA N6-adenosine threonylcarbamoyltransferase n=1 Tax=Pseudodesulfovibrio senegalensis TaxID=1721087 RepID=A0A6N6N3G8_9BACT|nr:tRNA (adenosine(37)-N6)-threonylcarbamoyltransferase complex transferase subunit TsaD [Pseudodesulfovibrio senegalensis]KAB1441218.1 tRNA (adenosine(37)-N6)-threonylcarbamoyltransferase complex transferase subunit TsaD [Pseudodesulfovibrio senegalensis]